jgi:hypothetical protein
MPLQGGYVTAPAGMSRTAHGTPPELASPPGPAPPNGTDPERTQRHQGGRGHPAATDRRADRRPLRDDQQPAGPTPPHLHGGAARPVTGQRGTARHRTPGHAGPVLCAGHQSCGGGFPGASPGGCRGVARDAPQSRRVGPGHGLETRARSGRDPGPGTRRQGGRQPGTAAPSAVCRPSAAYRAAGLSNGESAGQPVRDRSSG